MKYIITESKLDMLMTEYMDNFLEDKKVEWETGTMFILDEFNGAAYLEYNKMDGMLYISVDLMTNFMTWFSRNVGETKDFIQNWFENKFNVEVNDSLSSFF